RRIETVALGKLQREAFGEITREQPDGLEGLADRERCRDIVRSGAEAGCHFGYVRPHIAVVVEVLGQFAGDEPSGWIDKGEGDLLADMVAQRDGSSRH